EELNELKALSENPLSYEVEVARHDYQQELVENKDSTELRQQHHALLEKKVSEERLQLVEKIDQLLGESEHNIKQGALMSQLMLGRSPDEPNTVSPEVMKQLKEINLKTLTAQYDSVSDEDLAKYLHLLEKHPVLIKERAAVRRSVLQATQDTFALVGEIRQKLE